MILKLFEYGLFINTKKNIENVLRILHEKY
jgi:hypothetical protein